MRKSDSENYRGRKQGSGEFPMHPEDEPVSGSPAIPATPHSFEDIVQPALNALSLDALRDMQSHITERIRELGRAIPESRKELINRLSLQIAGDYEFDGETNLANVERAIAEAYDSGAAQPSVAPQSQPDAMNYICDDEIYPHRVTFAGGGNCRDIPEAIDKAPSVNREMLAEVAAGIASEISETQLTAFSRSPKLYANMVEIIVRHLEVTPQSEPNREMLEALRKAVEHGGYLADAAVAYLDKKNAVDMAKAGYDDSPDIPDTDGLSDCHQALRSRIFDFRKRHEAIQHAEAIPAVSAQKEEEKS